MKAKDHVRITNAAVNLYNSGIDSDVSKLLNKNCDLLVKGSEEADSKPIMVRATNWHFYNRNLSEDTIEHAIWEFQEPTVFHLSSDYILRKREEELDAEIEKQSLGDICNLVGRILHHVQDMSTPSHVIPVYHGILIKDSFEKYLHEVFLDDSDVLVGIAKAIESEKSIHSQPENRSIMALYIQAADNTLIYLSTEKPTFIAKVDDVEQSLPWTYFWEPEDVEHIDSYEPECNFAGFGNFGPLGKRFGETKEFERRGVRYKINKKVFDGICRDLTKKMLLDSVLTLQALDKRLQVLVEV